MMNTATILVFMLLLILFVLALRYSMSHGSCEACGGSCGSSAGTEAGHSCAAGGCKNCAHLAEEMQEVPERFRIKQ